ncbi:TPA: hypothetical protein EYO57_09995 [Candidatus Poribacteria bacterium]|nr:hypothetical protein [Candidatus Poribacteria bacterium]
MGKNVKKTLSPQPYWGFDDLFYKLGSKLHNCFFVLADSKKIGDQLHFNYQEIFTLRKLDKTRFINAIEKGNIFIDFDARTHHNHGTKFRLRKKHLLDLYKDVERH